ncbi:XRE family transcriptional regulator [Streptomyces sp. NPDC048002]|uniref:helix-turn-helix domain-containing protein n=1 Tax=unclassified Streptomyces TaxID=2593676 RepID=UPI0033C97502
MIDPLVERIATRIRAERELRRWTLAQLADASGVSRAMINRIERGESNPTAVVLGKLSAAFRLSVASLLAQAEEAPETAEPAEAGVRRPADDPEWVDPETGYRRRQIAGPRFPAEIAEIRLPAGARVPYPAAAFAFLHQLVWVLEGRLAFHDGDTVHDLGPGDVIELGDPAPRVFANTGDTECRYAVLLSRTARP